MFHGSHAITMDSKGRIAIPAKLRDLLSEICAGRLVATAHTEERCLLIYPEPQWQELVPKIEALPNMNRRARKVQRLLLGYATHLDMDANGRAVLPVPLRSYANLDKKLMLVGQGKKFELWSETSWFDWLDSEDDDGELPEEMQSLSY